jgi:hypothetical protein
LISFVQRIEIQIKECAVDRLLQFFLDDLTAPEYRPKPIPTSIEESLQFINAFAATIDFSVVEMSANAESAERSLAGSFSDAAPKRYGIEVDMPIDGGKFISKPVHNAERHHFTLTDKSVSVTVASDPAGPLFSRLNPFACVAGGKWLLTGAARRGNSHFLTDEIRRFLSHQAKNSELAPKERYEVLKTVSLVVNNGEFPTKRSIFVSAKASGVGPDTGECAFEPGICYERDYLCCFRND